MGEAAELLLDGIVDASGEYTGINPGHPVYPKGWFGNKKSKNFQSSYPNVKRVKDFFLCRGIPKGDQQKNILLAYGKHVPTDRPTNHACSNWKEFKAFVDEQIGYVKPSKQKKGDN